VGLCPVIYSHLLTISGCGVDGGAGKDGGEGREGGNVCEVGRGD